MYLLVLTCNANRINIGPYDQDSDEEVIRCPNPACHKDKALL